jgi:hypothetical protein
MLRWSKVKVSNFRTSSIVDKHVCRGCVTVAADGINSDVLAQIIKGPATGIRRHVKILNSQSQQLLHRLLAKNLQRRRRSVPKIDRMLRKAFSKPA